MKEEELLNQIKLAVENDKGQDFPGMEKIWNRVEEKLDNKKVKKAVWRWKKIAIAASLLLFGTLVYDFFYNKPQKNSVNEVVTSNDSSKVNNVVITNSEPQHQNPSPKEIKPNAEKILQSQIKNASEIAINEERQVTVNPTTYSTWATPETNSAPSPITEKQSIQTKTEDIKSSNVEIFANQNNKISTARKEEPLVVIDSKVSKKKLEGMEFDADSLVVLKEPLYIINGVEYTEQEVFGPNPTSPYTPLNQQEIESLTVLQNDKAVALYGTKGKKGVVIITTKDRKPAVITKKTK